LNGEEGSLLTESGWPKLINVKQLYEDHQAHLQADPSIQGFAAVEDITVRDIDTGQEHVGYDDRQPFIYYPPAKTVFIGNVGSWHANVAMTVAEQFGYERDSLYQSPQGIIRKGRVDG